MIKIHGHALSIMVLYAVTLHYAWAIALFFDDSAAMATGIHSLERFISMPVLPWAIASAATMALIGIFVYSPWFLMLLLPQQFMLMISAAGAIDAISMEQFADGTMRPFWFVLADQCNSVFAAVWHTVAIIAHARRSF